VLCFNRLSTVVTMLVRLVVLNGSFCVTLSVFTVFANACESNFCSLKRLLRDALPPYTSIVQSFKQHEDSRIPSWQARVELLLGHDGQEFSVCRCEQRKLRAV